MDVEDVLDQVAEANAIDRADEFSFDSEDFPKTVLHSQMSSSDEVIGSDGSTYILYGEPSFTPDEYNDGAHAAMDALVWQSTDDNGEPVGDIDMTADLIETVRNDFDEFLDENPVLVQRALNSGQTIEQIGHDYVLTRNGHGSGFWDRGLGKLGDDLTEAAQANGEIYTYVGEDGVLHA